MGRDLTPKEHHDIDLRWGFAKKRLALKTTDGEEILIYDPDCEMAHRLPNLYYLFNESTERIVEKYGERAFPVLDLVEKKVAEEIFGRGDDRIVHDWYVGKLDPDFFYNEVNNKRFSEYIENQIE